MRFRRVAIIDGYTDEPGGLGVPPYLDVYTRYIAGSIWLVDKSIPVHYYTIDTIRRDLKSYTRRLNNYDLVIIIAGVVVPGRYLGGKPLEPNELMFLLRTLRRPFKVLVGPAARWGLGWAGGRPAYPPRSFLRAGADVLVTGDPEEYIYNLLIHGEERAEPWRIRENYDFVDKVSVKGAPIIRQHPNYGRNLVIEIETYRGCARWITGGCSFCVEPLRGRPISRDSSGIVSEVEALYNMGARNFRLGRQADILVYGSEELGSSEWPRPNPRELEKLFYGIRKVAPRLETLHIDNVNPGTIVRHVEASIEALKIIVSYHTPGDVAAFGLESADPLVASLNNLNVDGDTVIEAVRIINRVGRVRGDNGLPHLLPGLNFILGLPGETRKTYEMNRHVLERILEEKLLVRRVNVRRLLPLPSTRVFRMKHGVRNRLEKHARSFVYFVRNVFEREMLKLVAPSGIILRGLWVESCSDGYCYARQPGSYPLTVVVRGNYPLLSYIPGVKITRVHSSRSLLGEVLDVKLI